MAKATFTKVSKGINARRNELNAICDEFRAVWCKVYRSDLTDELNFVMAEQKIYEKGTPEREEWTNKRYALECIAAKVKSLQISDEERDAIKACHEKMTFDDLNADWCIKRLKGTSFVNESGNLCERKRNKETGEHEFVEVTKWTVCKLGKFFRLAMWAE